MNHEEHHGHQKRQQVQLNNGRISISIGPGTGRIQAVRNLSSQIDLIDAALDTPPWRVKIDGQEQWLERFNQFSCILEEGAEGPSALLRWETEFGLALSSRVRMPAGGDSIFLSLEVENRGDLPVDKVEYPILSGIGPLVRAAGPAGVETALVHSQATGFLFYNPLALFLPEAGPGGGLRYSPYPEGFSGSTMQFMAYYAVGRGGFYFATRDSGRAMKWYNFFKDPTTSMLFATFMHQVPHVERGAGFTPGYEIEISALVEGNWYEAAERYKAWAVRQPWTQQGPASGRKDRARWLMEKPGICTFGINASHDRSTWLNAFHQIAGTPVLHILGPNWTRTTQDYHNNLPGGTLDDWFPARFSSENLAAIRDSGDYWAPFEFNLLCSYSGDSPAPVMESRQVIPRKKYSLDRYIFPYMCPGTEFWRAFHARRDTEMVRQNGPDGIYYDISSSNVLMACTSLSHEHQPGAGEEIFDAFENMYVETKESMAEVAGHLVPIGTEMISELFLPTVDFYQARAEASPLSIFEADFWRKWIIEGKVEKIPLFTFVYHEYGPVRLDGWGKLSPQAGSLFYWTAARVALWGGLFELNYEFSPLEMLDGCTEDPAEHYYDFAPREYPVDPGKAAFVGEIARARAGWANDYLAFGVMLRPPEIEAPAVEMDYFLYNAFHGIPQYEEKGNLAVRSVVRAAWRYGREKTAVFFANLMEEPQAVRVRLEDLKEVLEKRESPQVYELHGEGSRLIGPLAENGEIELLLPPRRIVALEVR